MTDSTTHFRSLIDKPAPGVWNMAVDEVLLISALERDCLSMRVYQWEMPTVSLGYFQSPQDPALDEQFKALPRVRRLSGGGAILHDREVTYSCAIPRSHPLAGNPVRIYEVVHEAIIALLAQRGVSATLRGTAKQEPEPFLCFGRGDPRDIVIGADKIVGSAQRRRAGAILQHGAILLVASSHAPEFPGIRELTGIDFDPAEFSMDLSHSIGPVLGIPQSNVAAGALTTEEWNLASEWARSRYG